MQEIEDIEDWNNAISNNTHTLICFSAKWCGPCKMLKPNLESLSNNDEYKNIGFYTVDVDKNEELSKSLNITSLPTIVIVSSGREYARIIGVNLLQLVEKLDSVKK